MLTHMKKDFISKPSSQRSKDKETFSSFSQLLLFHNSETYVVWLKQTAALNYLWASLGAVMKPGNKVANTCTVQQLGHTSPRPQLRGRGRGQSQVILSLVPSSGGGAWGQSQIILSLVPSSGEGAWERSQVILSLVPRGLGTRLGHTYQSLTQS